MEESKRDYYDKILNRCKQATTSFLPVVSATAAILKSEDSDEEKLEAIRYLVVGVENILYRRGRF